MYPNPWAVEIATLSASAVSCRELTVLQGTG